MNLLAIETSTDACSVALAIGDEARVDHRVAPREHARLVLPMIDALLVDAGLARSSLDGIAFGRGPGSFTGVRIAASVTQGIALGLDIGVVGVSTLATIAEGCRREFGDARIGAALDARLDEIYWGAFEAVGDADIVRAVGAERVCEADAVTFERSTGRDRTTPESARSASADRRGRVADANGANGANGRSGLTLAGPGAERYADALRAALGEPSALVLRDGRLPEARDTLALARLAISTNGLADAATAVPVYLRERVALTERERGVRASP